MTGIVIFSARTLSLTADYETRSAFSDHRKRMERKNLSFFHTRNSCAARVDRRHRRSSRTSAGETRRRQSPGPAAGRGREGSGTVANFGTKLYVQPGWLPVMEFPWWICFGTIVTFFVAILFRTGREHHPGVVYRRF